MAGEISFFELGVADAERARAFYGELFGWTFTPGPGGEGGYAIETPTVPGGVHGADSAAAPYLFFRVPIPMPGGAESLNAGVAAGVVLYEAAKQRG